MSDQVERLEKSLNHSLLALRNILQKGGDGLAKKTGKKNPSAQIVSSSTSPAEDPTIGDDGQGYNGNDLSLIKAEEDLDDDMDDYEDDDFEDEEDDFETPPEPAKKKMKKGKQSFPPKDNDQNVMQKSLHDVIVDLGGDEAEIAMDAEPFLRAMADSTDERFAKLEKSINMIGNLVQQIGNVTLKSATLQKALGDLPFPSSSILSKSRAAGPGEAPKPRTLEQKQQILSKSFELIKSKQIDPVTATQIEHCVNKDAPLPPKVAGLFDVK